MPIGLVPGGGTDAVAQAAAAAAQASADAKPPSVMVALGWPIAGSSTVQESIPFPFDGAKVARIQVAPVGTAGTGTLAVAQGITGAGNNMLSAASFDLSTLTDDTAEDLTLTGTAADLLGDAGDFLQIEVINTTATLSVVVMFEVA